jgi:hypothetical protein
MVLTTILARRYLRNCVGMARVPETQTIRAEDKSEPCADREQQPEPDDAIEDVSASS